MSDQAGWSRTPGRKWCYFTPGSNGRSLCGRWGFNTMPRQQGNDDSADNCKACQAKVKNSPAGRSSR